MSFALQITGVFIFLSQKTQAASSCLAVFRWTWRTRRCEASRTQSSQDCWSAGSLVRLSVLPMSAPLSACQAPRFYLTESLDAVCVLGWNRKAQRWFIFFDPNRLIIWLLKARFCSVLLQRNPLFEDLIYWPLIAVSCLQVLKSSRRRSASLLGSNTLRRCRAEWPSSLGSRPTTSASTCTTTEEARHMWQDSSLGHDRHRPFWSSFMQTYCGPSPPYILSGPPYLMVSPVLE